MDIVVSIMLLKYHKLKNLIFLRWIKTHTHIHQIQLINNVVGSAAVVRIIYEKIIFI